jgi:hypothetical protein
MKNIKYKRFTIREFSAYYSKTRSKRFTIREFSAYYSKTRSKRFTMGEISAYCSKAKVQKIHEVFILWTYPRNYKKEGCGKMNIIYLFEIKESKSKTCYEREFCVP